MQLQELITLGGEILKVKYRPSSSYKSTNPDFSSGKMFFEKKLLTS